MVPGTSRKAPKKIKKRIRKNLSIYFDSGKYELSEIQKEQIKKLVNQFKDKSSVKIKVTGFADDVGNKEFNLSLSQKRAGEVAQYIQIHEIGKEQVIYDGKGIVQSNVAKHQKRRVEIIIID